jgi:hypothetical protein
VAPEEDAKRLIAGRFVERVLTDEDFDVGFSVDQETAVHRLQGLWRRLRQEDHKRQLPYERSGLRRTPLPAAVGKEYLDRSGAGAHGAGRGSREGVHGQAGGGGADLVEGQRASGQPARPLWPAG